MRSTIPKARKPSRHCATLDQPDRRVINAFTSCVCSWSDRSTPQKLFCGSTDTMPACCSLGAICRIHAIRNFAFFEPRCKVTIIPGCNWARRPPRRAPVWVMSTVCARWFTVSSVTFTGNTIFLRGEVRWFSMGRLLSRVERSRKSYWSYHPNKPLSRAELLTVSV